MPLAFKEMDSCSWAVARAFDLGMDCIWTFTHISSSWLKVNLPCVGKKTNQTSWNQRQRLWVRWHACILFHICCGLSLACKSATARRLGSV